MKTLNYWLGKLVKLQLYGKGVLPLIVVNPTTGKQYTVVDVTADFEQVKIEIH